MTTKSATTAVDRSASRAARPNVIFIAGRDSGIETCLGAIASHPEIAALETDDFAHVPGGLERFPLNSFDPAFTDSPDHANAFEAIASRFAGSARHILWQPGYAIELPHVGWIASQHVPDARILFCLRDPVEAAWTRWQRRRNELAPTIHETIEQCLDAMESVGRFENRGKWGSFLDDPTPISLFLQSGVYAPVVRRWCAAYPSTHVYLIAYETFLRDPARELVRAARFLSIDPARFRAPVFSPSGAEIPTQARERLESFYAPFNARLRAQVKGFRPPWA